MKMYPFTFQKCSARTRGLGIIMYIEGICLGTPAFISADVFTGKQFRELLLDFLNTPFEGRSTVRRTNFLLREQIPFFKGIH